MRYTITTRSHSAPSLGSTPGEIYAAWRAYPTYGFGVVVGHVLPGPGSYDWRDGQLWRVFPSTRRKIATARLATPDELAQVDWAIRHGTLQIEIRPPSGVAVQNEAKVATWVLHQATGRHLPPEPGR